MSFRTIVETERVAGHLGSCFNELYRALGEVAPTMSDDAAVVVAFEMARTFAEVASNFDRLSARRAGVDPTAARVEVPIISELIAEARRRDETGALVLYGVAMVIGPRLLVSLRDATEGADLAAGGPLVRTAQSAATTLVAEVRRIGEVAARRGPTEDPVWLDSAGYLAHMAETAGYAESLGTGTVG